LNSPGFIAGASSEYAMKQLNLVDLSFARDGTESRLLRIAQSLKGEWFVALKYAQLDGIEGSQKIVFPTPNPEERASLLIAKVEEFVRRGYTRVNVYSFNPALLKALTGIWPPQNRDQVEIFHGTVLIASEPPQVSLSVVDSDKLDGTPTSQSDATSSQRSQLLHRKSAEYDRKTRGNGGYSAIPNFRDAVVEALITCCQSGSMSYVELLEKAAAQAHAAVEARARVDRKVPETWAMPVRVSVVSTQLKLLARVAPIFETTHSSETLYGPKTAFKADTRVVAADALQLWEMTLLGNLLHAGEPIHFEMCGEVAAWMYGNSSVDHRAKVARNLEALKSAGTDIDVDDSGLWRWNDVGSRFEQTVKFRTSTGNVVQLSA
jgi:hypothetical protein